VIWVKRKVKFFCEGGWTGESVAGELPDVLMGTSRNASVRSIKTALCIAASAIRFTYFG
jgi:hypothetical protein